MKKLSLILFIMLIALAACGTHPADQSSSDTSAESIVKPAETESIFDTVIGNYTFDGTLITAPQTAEDEPVYSAAIYSEDLCSADFSAEVDITLDTIYSEGGIVVRGEEADSGFIHGYYFAVKDRKCYLYSIDGTKASGLKLNELGRKAIEDYKRGDSLTLRVEAEGKTFRFYYLDDMEGVEPWPEFEFILSDYRSNGIGVMDNGYGAGFDNLKVDAYTPPETWEQTYSNPVYNGGQAADPGVLYWDGVYYMYSTSAPIGYYVYTSTDMVNWENAGLCMEEAWGIDRSGYYWAPEVIAYNGKFYMIASVDEHIGFAIAESPLGPFVPCENWLFDDSIDGHVFIDDDGTPYLFFVSWRSGHEYGIYGMELEADLVTPKPETEKLIIKPRESWEKVDGGVTEGPYILKHNGIYYLTYSGTGYTSQQYAVGYATSDSPLGEYTRYEGNPVLSYTSKLYGVGHHSFTTSPDGSELFIVYHAHASSKEVHPRVMCIDRVRFAPTESGIDRIEIYGPTHTKQDFPK